MPQTVNKTEAAKLSNNKLKNKTVSDINTTVNGCCCKKYKEVKKCRRGSK